jgi:transcriptional regulator with XRE-family HTH domain
MEIEDIGTQILLARRKRGLRQGEVAKLAGISAKQMSQIEPGNLQVGKRSPLPQLLRCFMGVRMLFWG